MMTAAHHTLESVTQPSVQGRICLVLSCISNYFANIHVPMKQSWRLRLRGLIVCYSYGSRFYKVQCTGYNSYFEYRGAETVQVFFFQLIALRLSVYMIYTFVNRCRDMHISFIGVDVFLWYSWMWHAYAWIGYLYIHYQLQTYALNATTLGLVVKSWDWDVADDNVSDSTISCYLNGTESNKCDKSSWDNIVAIMIPNRENYKHKGFMQLQTNEKIQVKYAI